MKALVSLVLAILLATNAYGAIKIGSKKDSESNLLAEMLAQVLENKYGLEVERKLNLGGTQVAFEALRNGDIDTYPEYTGTAYAAILKQSGLKDSKEIYQYVQKAFQDQYKITWSPSLGFNNTYALAVKKNDSRFDGKDTLSALAKISRGLKLGSPYEFMERPDGFAALKDFYQFQFQQNEVISMEAGLMYTAINQDEVDAIIVYSTDGRINAFDLKLLKDDRSFFPPYEASFISHTDNIKKRPQLQEAMALFENLIPESEMTALNDRVDRLKESPAKVARDFLSQRGIIAPSKTSSSTGGFWKENGEKVLRGLREHLLISFIALLIAILISVPTGIWMAHNERVSKVVFPIVNTIQTLPSLALLGFMVPLIGIGFLPALIALVLYSLLPIIQNTYTGIHDIDSKYIESAKGMGLTQKQILFHVELPLGLPVILAGIRTSSVIIIGTATIAALIGAGGLGDLIFRGVSTVNTQLILAGAIPAALLAIIVDRGLGWVGHRLISPGLRIR